MASVVGLIRRVIPRSSGPSIRDSGTSASLPVQINPGGPAIAREPAAWTSTAAASERVARGRGRLVCCVQVSASCTGKMIPFYYLYFGFQYGQMMGNTAY